MKTRSKLESNVIVNGIVLMFAAGGFNIGVTQELKLSDAQVAEAIAYGKSFKTRAEFLKKGLARKQFKIGRDALVTFYGDTDVISAAVAEANQKMRELSRGEIECIPRTGLLFANVEIRSRHVGIGGRRSGKSLARYMDGAAHVVLKIGDKVVQPVEIGAYPSPPKSECYQTLYLWSVFGSINFAVGGVVPIALPCVSQGPDKIAIEFGFRLPENQWRPAEVILIDGDGNRQRTEVDLSKVR